MHSVGATFASPARSSMDTFETPDIEKMVHQLATAAVPGQCDEFKPAIGAWDALSRLKSASAGMTREQKNGVESALSAALATTNLGSLDVQLLKDVVHAALGAGGEVSPEQYLARRTFEHLCLPDLVLLESGEVEPNSRTFNSILPSLAASTYDYGVLGRTLLWKGACQLFAGPSNGARSDTLRQVTFGFPNPPKPGEDRLEQFWEFVMAVDALGLDEPVDIEAIRQGQSLGMSNVQDVDQR
jgi:hypothetical protein